MHDRVGQQLGDYHLLRLLSSASSADFYLGEHQYTRAQATIQVFRAVLAQEETEQFRNEARTLSRLVHPHILRIFDFPVVEGIAFLVMDSAPHGAWRDQ